MARVSLSWALILGLLSGIGPLCTDFYLPALPEITQQLQATSTQTQLSLTAALIGLGLGQLFFGPLSDRIGRLKPLALSLLLFIFSSAMCALTRDINMLIVWRFLQGFAGAGGSVLSRSIARDKYQGTLLTQFFALLMTVNGIAPVLSPVLGGYVITAFDWRILFWTMAAIGGVLLVMSLAILRETRPATAAHASRQRPGQPVLKNRRFLRFCLIQAFMMAGLFSYIGSSSFVMQSEYGMSAMQFSLLFGLNGIGLIIAAMIFSRLARRFSAESLLRGGLTLAVSCAAIMLLFAWLHLPVLALVLSIALGVAVGGAGSITFPLPALIWCAVRYPLPLTCLLTFLTGIGEILLVANSLIHFSPDARMQPWQLFSTRLGIAAMLISPVIVASSVEAINTLVKQLALRADFDFQTRVYSRSGLSEALKRQTLPADKLLTVMVLDIDGFKRVNDALGHEGGDCVLTQFAQQVRQLVGEQGMVARIGGEEFAVAAVVDSAQQGYLLAEKIRHGVESQPFGLGQNPIHLTISLGLETREVGHARITELFNQLLLAADDEMVKAKQSGRNQICMPTLTESAP